MRRKNEIKLALVLVAALFSLIFLGAYAEAKSIEPIEGSKFDVSASIKDNLKFFAGRDVSLHLRSGKTLQGYIRAIGNDFVHLEKIAGRDFYDALIRIDDISAIEVKFRDMK